MEPDEEAGLRAFELKVGAYAGASYPERPQWVERDGARIDVTAVDASWREVERLGFRVRLADGSSALLYYVPELDLWSGATSPPAARGELKRRRGAPDSG
jgi:hypothetical protein